jgi:hypothetical protein
MAMLRSGPFLHLPVGHVEEEFHVWQHDFLLQRQEHFIDKLLKAGVLAVVFRVDLVVQKGEVHDC